jgi:hypothetical protein
MGTACQATSRIERLAGDGGVDMSAPIVTRPTLRCIRPQDLQELDPGCTLTSGDYCVATQGEHRETNDEIHTVQHPAIKSPAPVATEHLPESIYTLQLASTTETLAALLDTFEDPLLQRSEGIAMVRGRSRIEPLLRPCSHGLTLEIHHS